MEDHVASQELQQSESQASRTPFSTRGSLDELDFLTLDLLGGLLDDNIYDPPTFTTSSSPLPQWPAPIPPLAAYSGSSSVQDQLYRSSASGLVPAPMLPIISPMVYSVQAQTFRDSDSTRSDLQAQSSTSVMEGVIEGEVGRKRALGDGHRPTRQLNKQQRNREHAKSMRMRKRAYVEQLKQQLANLLMRNKELTEAKTSVHRTLDESDCATAVTTLITLRFAAVTDIKLWNSLVVPDFELHIPAGMLIGQDQLSGPPIGAVQRNGLRMLCGLNQVMQDIAHLQQLLQSVLLAFQMDGPLPNGMSAIDKITSYMAPQETPIALAPSSSRNEFHLRPSLNSEDIIMSDNVLMSSWALTVDTIVGYSFVAMEGMLECTFAPDGRIRKLLLFYDLMSLAGRVQDFRHTKMKMLQAAAKASSFA